ncbi:oligosaccharide flippase family protein [Vibrio chagasii]|uniref:oligosaccharide flippase family protein n=1 Tax=Vibrio chagasii TaxID=170679 RepID=UPI0038CD1B75
MLNILATGMFSRVCCTAATFSTGVLLAREYGKEAVGIYVLVLAARRFIFSITNMGYLTAIVYKFNNDNAMSRSEVVEIIKRILFFCVCALFITNLITYYFTNEYLSSYKSQIVPISLLVISTFFLNLSQRLASIFKKSAAINLSEIFIQSSFLLLSGLFSFINATGIGELLTALFLLEIIASLVIIYYLIDYLSHSKVKRKELYSISHLFAYSKWIYISNWINSIIVDFPVFSMNWLSVPLANIGVFSRSMTFVNLGRNLLNPMAKVIFPYFREGEERVITNYFKVVLTLILLFSPIMIIFGSYAEFIVKNIYGNDFIEAAEYLTIMAPILLIQPFNVVSNVFLTAMGKAKNVSIFSIFSLLILTVTSTYLFDSLGVKAIAVSILSQQVIIAICYLFLVIRLVRK